MGETLQPSKPRRVSSERDFRDNATSVEEHDQDGQSGESKGIVKGTERTREDPIQPSHGIKQGDKDEIDEELSTCSIQLGKETHDQ